MLTASLKRKFSRPVRDDHVGWSALTFANFNKPFVLVRGVVQFGLGCLRVELRVDFLLKTDSGYPKDTGVTLFTVTLATPGNPLLYNTHWSAPPVSALAHSRGPRKRSQSPVSRTRTQRHV